MLTERLLAAFNALSAADPLLLMLMLALTTLLLEDVALAAGAALATTGVLSWTSAFLAVAIGLAVGDLMLYAMGLFIRRFPRLRRMLDGDGGRIARAERLLSRHYAVAVATARVVPGLRLVVYTGAGYLVLPLLPFTLLVLLCVTVWTAGLFAIAAGLGDLVGQISFLPPHLSAAVLFILLVLVAWLMSRLGKRLFARGAL